jgi:hypothetical protein
MGDNTQAGLKEIGWDRLKCVSMALDRDKWQDVTIQGVS